MSVSSSPDLQWCALSRQGSEADDVAEVDGDGVESFSLNCLTSLQLLRY